MSVLEIIAIVLLVWFFCLIVPLIGYFLSELSEKSKVEKIQYSTRDVLFIILLAPIWFLHYIYLITIWWFVVAPIKSKKKKLKTKKELKSNTI